MYGQLQRLRGSVLFSTSTVVLYIHSFKPEAMIASYLFALWACLLGLAAADCGQYACDTLIPSYAQSEDGACVFSPLGSNLFAIQFVVW